MTSRKQFKNGTRPPEDSPAAWFVVLERARRINDFELASRARRELERLGVKVKYTSTRQSTGKGVDCE